MSNQSSKNRIAALNRKPKVDPEVSKQRLLDKLAPLRQAFNELPLGKAGKFVEVVHDCFPFNMYQHRYKDNGCSLWYLKTVLKNDVDEKFTFVDQHAPGEKGKGKGSIGRVLKLVISDKLWEYKLMRLAAEEELAAQGGTLPESTPEHGDVDTTANVASDTALREALVEAEAEREGQRKAIVEAKAIILSEITQLNIEFNEIKAAKEALTAQALKNRSKTTLANNRLATQHRLMEELNTKEE